jgi:ATP-dependent Clp protease adaptor protein ClpS
VSIAPADLSRTEIAEDLSLDRPWITLVWNDPVNLMSYVTYVFQTYFGYSLEKSEKLMLDVHQKGRAVVSNGAREKMERDTEALQGYGLWATLQRDD